MGWLAFAGQPFLTGGGMRKWLLGLVILLGSLPLAAQSTSPVSGYCDLGGSKAQVSGLGSTNYQQGDIPGCTITVYLHGTLTLATIYADSSNTPLSNPFTAVVSSSPNAGFYIFWAANGQTYDVVGSGGTAPNTYPSAQTIKEVALGGSGGGSTTPCGILYDIQLNDPLGTFGCDSGIFYENPTTHTLNLGTPSVGGTEVIQGPSGGTVTTTDANNQAQMGPGQYSLKQTSVNPTFLGAGYFSWLTPTGTVDLGLRPPNQIGTVGQALILQTVSGDVGTLTFGTPAASGQISQEYMTPVFTTNAPFPTTTNDLVDTLIPQLPDTYFAGPLPPTDPRSSVVGEFICDYSGTTAVPIVCSGTSLAPAFTVSKGDTIYVELPVGGGLGTVVASSTITDSQGDTFVHMVSDNGSGSTIPAESWYATNVKGGLTTFTITITLTGSNPFGAAVKLVELRGAVVPDVFAIDSERISQPAIQSVTTTNANDTILASLDIAPSCTLSPGTGYNWVILEGNGTLAGVHGMEATNVSSTSTYTPPMNITCSGYTGIAWTTAFTQDVFATSAPPTFRTPKAVDLCAGLDFNICPFIANDFLYTDGTQVQQGSFGTGLTFSGGVLTATGTGNLTGTLTTNKIPKATGAHTLGDSSVTDNGTTVSTTEPLAIGASPPTACGSATGCIALGEASTAGTPAAGADYCRADSTAHDFKCSVNNGAEAPLPIVGTSGEITISSSGAIGLDSSQKTKWCEQVIGGSGTSFALTSGDDAIVNNSCFNDSGITWTITAMKCRSDNGSNTTTINPTFGADGTGTTLCSGALTCGSSYAYSSSCTISNAAVASGKGFRPAMAGTLTGTSIVVHYDYTIP